MPEEESEASNIHMEVLAAAAVAAADLEALGKTAAVAAYLGMAMEALAATAELEVLGEAATELPEQQERPEGQGHQALLS